MFARIPLWSHVAGPGLLFLGRFLITVSITVFVIGLFIVSVSSWFSLGKLIFSKYLSISSRLSILLVPGASMGAPTHDNVMRKRPDRQGGSGLEGLPGPARAPTPKPKSVCLLYTILCLSPTLLTLTGGYPWPPFSGENQLRALVDKSPGHERNISIQTPLLAF